MIFDLDELPIEEKKQAEFIQKIITIGQIQSKALCAQVVLYRSLAISKQIALICMDELSRRRKDGEEFNYEEYIETELKKIPEIKPTDLKAIPGMLNIKALSKMIIGGTK